MALKKNLEFRGILVPDAYIKIATTTIIAGNEWIDFCVHYLATDTGSPFNSVNVQCAYNLLGDNPIKQGYEHLKTLPEFEGCTDC
jgi:hypothetical protein